MQVVFATLELAARDAACIEALRRRRDPQAALVAAHFTLVFPFQGVPATAVLAHVSQVAAGAAPIAFRLASSMAVRDLLAPRSHVFLTPDLGAEEIVALHDRLYAGLLAPFLRRDIAYAPHVTVAAMEAHGDAKALAEALGPIDIRGRIAALTLASLTDSALVDAQRLPLSKGAGP